MSTAVVPQSQADNFKLDVNYNSTESNICYELFCNLTWSERILGYIVCSFIGYFITFGSIIRINEALHGDPMSRHTCFIPTYKHASRYE